MNFALSAVAEVQDVQSRPLLEIGKEVDTIEKKKKQRMNQRGKTKSAKQTLRVVAQGYGDAGASTTKRSLKGFTPTSGSAVRDIDDNNYQMRQRARMLYMSSPLATSAIRTNRTNVVGKGLVPQPAIDAEFLGLTPEQAKDWQDRAYREFHLWANNKRNCDATGVNNFYGLQQLALMSWLMSGDVFGLVKHVKADKRVSPYGLRIHLIEADRIATPSTIQTPNMTITTVKLSNGRYVHDGVEVDKDGAIAAYYIRNTYPQEWTGKATEYARVEAYGKRTGLPNILHVMDSERPEQYRGVSYLAQVIEPLLQIRRYSESELVAAVIESFFTAFIKTESDLTDMPYAEMQPEDDREISVDPNEYEMGPGQINVMAPGEDIVFGDPKRPSSGFSAFVESMAEQIGAALEVPRDLLMKSFNASYSASRAALMEAWKSFSMRRVWFVDDFCAPIWELWMSEAVAIGRLNAPGFFTDPAIRQAYLGCNWIGPSQGQLDPTKEINAEIMAIEQGLTTRRDAAIRLNGSDWDNNIKQVGYENELMSSIPVPSALVSTFKGSNPEQNNPTEETNGN